MRNIILGTAGHIDHGKSSLVKALTGIDPDRLKEEKERGITIDIGFAELEYPENELIVGIVDVPGHEKLIRNMLAGAGGIDLVLMVIAADEGIMPQSLEHLAICNLLRIKSGLIALTKSDLVEQEWLDLVKEEIVAFTSGTFLEGAPIIPVSSKKMENIDLLKNEIRDIALRVIPKTSHGVFRMPIDRVFTLKGFGTVITGTSMAGKVSIDDHIDILPGKIRTKVRGLHSHGRQITQAYAGQRVAINLKSVEKEDIKRGDVATAPVFFTETKVIDAFLELLNGAPALKTKNLVHFYNGTTEKIARVILYGKDELKAGEGSYCQFRLNEPVVTLSGDRYIIRRFSPLETLGGGEILDPHPRKRKIKEGIEDLKSMHNGTFHDKIATKILGQGSYGYTVSELSGWTIQEEEISNAIDSLVQSSVIVRHEDLLIHQHPLSLLREKVKGILKAYHKNNPLKSGMSKEEVRNYLKVDQRIFGVILSMMVKDIVIDKDLLRLREFSVLLSHDEDEWKTKIQELLEKGRFQPPSKEELASLLKLEIKKISDILSLLSKEEKIIKINELYYLSAIAYQELIDILKRFFSKKQEMSVAEFRDLLNTSRKFALPFLEYLDSHKVTLRVGDIRKCLLKN